MRPDEDGLLDITIANNDPNEIDPPLWRKLLKLSLKIIKALPLLITVSALGYLYYYHSFLIPGQVTEKTNDIKKLAKAFQRDVVIAYKFPIFPKPGIENDAGLILNSRIEWTNTIDPSSLENNEALQLEQLETGEFQPQNPNDQSTQLDPGLGIDRPASNVFNTLPMIELPPDLKELVNKNFPTLPEEPIEFVNLDLGWFKDLAEFDHWDIEASDQTQIAILSGIYPDEFPAPDYEWLRTLARLELYRGLAANKVYESFQNVHRLAFLVNSHETTESHKSAHKLLNDILKVMSTLEEDIQKDLLDKFKEDGYYLRPKALQSHQRIPEGYTFLFNLFTVSKVQKFLNNTKYFEGKCTALRSTMNEVTKYMPLLNKPYENSLNTLTKVLERHRKICRINYTRSIWAHVMSQPNSRTAKAILGAQGPYYNLLPAIPSEPVRDFIAQSMYIDYLSGLDNPYLNGKLKDEPKSSPKKEEVSSNKETDQTKSDDTE